MQEVIAYLDNVDPLAAARARDRYACFDHTSADDGQAYGFAAAFGAGLSCERQAIDQLIEMQRKALDYARRDGLLAEDELFYAQQNAQTVRNAEVYYRAMFGGRVTSWNLRDQHMAQTLHALLAHLDRHGGSQPARIVVWAHNSHVGDARATEVGTDGQLTLGQLVREQYGEDVATDRIHDVHRHGHRGQRMGWDRRAQGRPACAERQRRGAVPRDRQAGIPGVADRSAARPREPLDVVRLGRAIGVIYLPATERQSHYYHVRPGEQFDAIIHIDRTRALEPLEVTSSVVAGETPETYPTGL